VKSHTVTVTATSGGRLRIEVALGPANPYQEDTAQAQAAGTAVYTTTARIGAAR
jgi:hypothetical protein